MRIEVLTVSHCPNRALALERLDAALDLVRIGSVEVTERVIDDPAEAVAAGMHGSPTVLVDGRDPFAEPGMEGSVSCRLYVTAAGLAGAPSVDDLIGALTGGDRQ